MYSLSVEDHFAAAHQLREYKGKCENLHGHNWRVCLTVCGEELDRIGLLVDFGKLKDLLGITMAKLDHVNVNEVKPFDRINPTSENLARFIYEDVEGSLPEGIAVESVTVWESEKCSATYRA